ncbi:MspA family porin [Nocardia jejuensis]|uniref:MspA family porin n=1 Tax=Nocardia jejuensis TaxID=328049 RepID=UPI0014712EC6|nr:MspA family porin [Nocardia jejuensis]
MPIAVMAAVGYVLTAAQAGAAAVPHERTYSTPTGFAFTVGSRDLNYRPVPSLNGMPTNREVFLDNTSYGQIPAGATGKLKTGYYVACQVDIDAKLNIDPELDPNPGATFHVGADEYGPHAGVDLSVGPTVYGGVGILATIAPGKIVDVVAGEQDLPGNGTLGYLVNQDFHLMVNGCGGPLTLRPYTLITAKADGDGGTGAVYGDPITL